MPERLKKFDNIEVSDDLKGLVENIGNLELVPSLPVRLQELNKHLQKRVEGSLQKLSETGNRYEICGPDWSRKNPEIAGKAHADVIVKTYGSTYALPNKYPEQNVKALAEGNMDMYLISKVANLLALPVWYFRIMDGPNSAEPQVLAQLETKLYRT